MKCKLLININAFYLLLDHTVQQYYQPILSQFQYNPYQNIQNVQPQYSNQNRIDKWNVQENKHEYSDNDAEECLCDDCVNLKLFCQNVCSNCLSQQPPPVMPPMTSSYFYFQFPYPYFIIPNVTAPSSTTTRWSTREDVTSTSLGTTPFSFKGDEETEEGAMSTTLPTTTKTTIIAPRTTTPIATTTTQASTIPEIFTETKSATDNNIIRPSVDGVPISLYMRKKDKIPYMPTALRRTKPNWTPKHGVPISGQFAEKLIPRMRNMRMLHSRTSNLRNVVHIVP